MTGTGLVRREHKQNHCVHNKHMLSKKNTSFDALKKAAQRYTIWKLRVKMRVPTYVSIIQT